MDPLSSFAGFVAGGAFVAGVQFMSDLNASREATKAWMAQATPILANAGAFLSAVSEAPQVETQCDCSRTTVQDPGHPTGGYL